MRRILAVLIALSLVILPADGAESTKYVALTFDDGPSGRFTRRLLEERGIPHERILGVHQPFMERRITAAMGVYWPEQDFRVTSPQTSIADYLADAKRQGVTENAAVSVIVGDFQRMDLYAKKGYQTPQYIPPEAWEAFHRLVEMGFDTQLAK